MRCCLKVEEGAVEAARGVLVKDSVEAVLLLEAEAEEQEEQMELLRAAVEEVLKVWKLLGVEVAAREVLVPMELLIDQRAFEM